MVIHMGGDYENICNSGRGRYIWLSRGVEHQAVLLDSRRPAYCYLSQTVIQGNCLATHLELRRTVSVVLHLTYEFEKRSSLGELPIAL